MKNNITEFLSSLAIFESVPIEEIEKLSKKITIEEYKKGKYLFYQGKSEVKNVYIIKKGKVELFFEKEGKKEIAGFLGENEAFGGISILMNSCIMVRNIRVEEDVLLYVMPKKFFLELCARFDSFYEHFVDSYSGRMLDKMYASVVISSNARSFLASVAPFSFIPEDELKKIVSFISVVSYPKDIELFTAGESKIEHIYILKSGTCERYKKEEEKIVSEIMEPGDIYGGAALLLNKGIPLYSLKTKESVSFYKLAAEHFFNLCIRFNLVSEFFTDTLGKGIFKKSYSSFITESSPEDSLEFFNNKIENICNPNLVFCSETSSIQEAASIMSGRGCSSILVKNSDEKFIGIVTDSDLRKKVIAEGYDIHKPVSDIMSSPLITMPDYSLIFEAFIDIVKKNKRHLAISDINGKVIGMVTHRDMLSAQGNSPFLFIREISSAKTLESIIEKQTQLSKTIHGLINKGAKSENITRFVTAISDAILEKLVKLAIEDLGEPKAKFVFMVMGSEGRQEQTLKTDQDNAIIFEDVPKDKEDEVREYFLRLGEKVCGWLDSAGYKFCEGNVMAKNPKLCQPLSKWKTYFHSWIYEAEPKDLLNASIFFDFRKGCGEDYLIDELRQFLFDSLKNWSGFFRRLTENALYFKPPLGIFKNFILESKGKHKDSFDIKRAMQPVVDFARIYALKYSIEETNTHERLNKLYVNKILSHEDYKDIDQSYSFMMQLRFVRQVKAIIYEKEKPHNYINPNKLSRLEQKMLKEIFKKIEKFQANSGLTFMGV